MEYMNARQAAEKWHLDRRSVQRFCSSGRIEGAIQEQGAWLLPVDAKKPEDRRVKSGKYRKSNLKRKTILIAEDNDVNRDMLKSIFDEEFDILEAKDGQEAIEFLHQKKVGISLVLLDLMMPRKDGIEVLQEMKTMKLDVKVPVIMITGEATIESDKKAYSLGVSDIIYKPFSSPIVKQRALNYIELFEMRKKKK